MVKILLKNSLRFFKKNKLFTVTNILGLSIALAASFIIIFYLINELTYNNCHKKRKNIYKILSYDIESKSSGDWTPFILAQTLKEEIPQIENATNTVFIRDLTIKSREVFIDNISILSTNCEVFEIFTIPIIIGGAPQKLFCDKYSIFISNKIANKLFPDINPVGNKITTQIGHKQHDFTVVGVFEDLPQNSTLKADCIINENWGIDKIDKFDNTKNAKTSWEETGCQTWILLSKHSSLTDIDNQLKTIESKYLGSNPIVKYSLQNLSAIYLQTINLSNINLFTIIAFLIVIIATLNYIILSVAIVIRRSNEIGVKRTFGASYKDIQKQLIIESMLLTLFVLPISVLLMLLIFPWTNLFFHTKLIFIKSNLILYTFSYSLIVLLVGILSGFFSTAFLSRFKVVTILKNCDIRVNKKHKMGSFLIIVQLIIFCSLVSCSIIIWSQYHYAIKKDIGFNNRDIIFINMNNRPDLYSPFHEAVMTNPNVINISGGLDIFPKQASATMMVPYPKDESIKVKMEFMMVSYDFINTMGITLAEGRDFSQDFGTDLEQSIIINEEAVKQLDLTKPIGTKLLGKTIIGVVKNFNAFSIDTQIPPIMISLNNQVMFQTIIHFMPGSINSLLPNLQEEWEKLAPNIPFKYTFLEDNLKDKYQSIKKVSISFLIFTGISLLISSLGLLGFTLFDLHNKTREISIRKVLGCSSKRIIITILKKYLKFVIIALFFSIVCTTYFMSNWLSNYSYHVSISLWSFITSFFLAILIVSITVFLSSLRTSSINPSITLRSQ